MIKPGDGAQAIAKQLKQTGRKATIFIGEYALSHPQAAAIRTLARLISRLNRGHTRNINRRRQ